MKFLKSIGLATLFGSLCAHAAKTVRLEWEAIEKAKAYEIRVWQEEKLVAQERVTEQSVKLELDYGLHRYKIRAIDAFDRPGAWSQDLNLVVMPPVPTPRFPTQEHEIYTLHEQQYINLKWTQVDPDALTEVTLSQGDEIIMQKVFSGNEGLSPVLPTGDYEWSLRSLVKTNSKEFKSDASEIIRFKIVYQPLEAPKLLAPRGLVVPKNIIEFSWEPERGADQYAFKLSNAKGLVREENTPQTKLDVENLTDGLYQWSVSALSNAGFEGPTATEEFRISKDLALKKGSIWGVAPYYSKFQYSTESYTSGFKRDYWGTKMGLSAVYENWNRRGSGFTSDFKLHRAKIEAKDWFTADLGIHWAYRRRLGNEGGGSWILSPRIGLALRQMNELIPNYTSLKGIYSISSYSMGRVFSEGLQAQVYLDRRGASKWGYGFGGTYFYPLLLQGPPKGSSLAWGDNLFNLSLESRFFYELSERSNLFAGLFMEHRVLTFTPPANVTSQISFYSGARKHRIEEQIWGLSLGYSGRF